MLATIDTTTYGDAARLLTHANQDAGAVAESLFTAIADASMSTGTTGGAATWAASYSAFAASVSDGISDLVGALGNAALLLDASGDNHARAEAAAAPYGLPSYALPQRALRSVRMSGLPPIFGGNADEPGGWHMVVAHLSGYTWPGADLGRLATLAAAWHRAAAGLRALSALPDRAGQTLGSMASPELPAAIAACTRLSSVAHALADDCSELGSAITRFADEVQRQRDPIYESVKDLVISVAWCEAGGFLVGAFSDGGGELAGKALEATIITRCATRIVALLRALDEALPTLKPLLVGATAADRGWLTMMSEARPVAADIRTGSPVLQSELDTAAGVGSGAGAAGALTDEQVIESGWANRRTLTRHLRDHGADVGAKTQAEYVRAAQELLRRARAEGLPTKIDEDGVIRIFDPQSEMFASFNRDGRARTIFRPDNPAAYWSRQEGVLQ